MFLGNIFYLVDSNWAKTAVGGLEIVETAATTNPAILVSIVRFVRLTQSRRWPQEQSEMEINVRQQSAGPGAAQ